MNEIVSKAPDTMLYKKLPKSLHVSNLILKHLPSDQQNNTPYLINRWNTNNNSVKDINNQSEIETSSTSNIHSYSFISHKPPNSYSGYRLAKPPTLINITESVESAPSSIDRYIPYI